MKQIHFYFVFTFVVDYTSCERPPFKRDHSGVNYAKFIENPFQKLTSTSISIASLKVSKLSECTLECLNSHGCYSVNFGNPVDGKHRCELLNTDKFTKPVKLVASGDFHHYNIKTPCMNEPCQNGATCIPVYNENDYHCVCVAGYIGKHCEIEISECDSSPCFNGGVCTDHFNAFSCTCANEYHGVQCQTVRKGYLASNPATSCKEVLSISPDSPSAAYYITSDGWGSVKTYCVMYSIGACGGGGWTMAMKIDGDQSTFSHSSVLWTNKDAHNHINGGQTGLDSSQTKMPSYWSTPFNKLCLGMTVAGTTRWKSLSYTTASLYALIADDQYRGTSLGVSEWKNFVGSGSLQHNCRYEGFNANLGGASAARLGVVGNNEIWCSEGNSWIGFGGHPGMSCGNFARWEADNGDRHTKAFCYILIQ